jgi:hypothetical protein
MKENKLQCSSTANSFAVECDAGSAGRFRVFTKSLSILVGQLVPAEGLEPERMWDSLLVTCGEAEDGSLDVLVRVFHPDWDEPCQFVLSKSHPNGRRADTPTLNVDLRERCEA